MIRIGLIGDRDESVIAHRAIPVAIELAAKALDLNARVQWCPTDSIDGQELQRLHGLWCIPASPYRDMDGALYAIRFAREYGRPFLGTCGGFQHAIIEYARSVLGWSNADHAETTPEAEQLIIAPLNCSLVEKNEVVYFSDGSRLRAVYGTESSSEVYHCSYGLNPVMSDELTGGALRVAAVDAIGDVRGLELEGHPFYVLTLFQPERAALRGVVPPIVKSFLSKCARIKLPA